MIKIWGLLGCEVCDNTREIWLEHNVYETRLTDADAIEAGWRIETKREYKEKIERESNVMPRAILGGLIVDNANSHFQDPSDRFPTCSDDCRKVYEATLRLSGEKAEKAAKLQRGDVMLPILVQPQQVETLGVVTVTTTGTGTGEK